MPASPVVRRLIADHRLAAAEEVGHVEVRRITLGAGVAAGPHVHNGPVLGVIVAGSVVVQVDGGEPVVLHVGDEFFEPARTRIDRFDATDEGVEFLAWFPLPSGTEGVLTPVD